MTNQMKFSLLAGVAILVIACNGWPQAGDIDVEANKPEKYLTYATTPADAVPIFVAEHHRYMVMPASTNLRVGSARQVGTATGARVFALEGDEAPFANLFAQAPDGRWRTIGLID
jgi:hypothetical protein